MVVTVRIIHGPPRSLLRGGIFRVTTYSCDIGGEMPGAGRKRELQRILGWPRAACEPSLFSRAEKRLEAFRGGKGAVPMKTPPDRQSLRHQSSRRHHRDDAHPPARQNRPHRHQDHSWSISPYPSESNVQIGGMGRVIPHFLQILFISGAMVRQKNFQSTSVIAKIG